MIFIMSFVIPPDIVTTIQYLVSLLFQVTVRMKLKPFNTKNLSIMWEIKISNIGISNC